VTFSSKCELIFRVMQAGQSVRSALARPPAALGRLLLPYGQGDNKYYRIFMSSYILSVIRQRRGRNLRMGWPVSALMACAAARSPG
jgi:hypothetical protein